MASKISDNDRQVREKLVFGGAKSLSDEELLGLLLSYGREEKGMVEMAGRVMSHFEGSMLELGRASIGRLRNVEGLGIDRAALLAVAFELGRRYSGSESMQKSVITSDGDVIEMFKPLIGDLPYEEFWAVCLSAGGTVLDRVKISQGGVSATVVDHRLIVKRAIEKLATAIVIVHNHPSGQPVPSKEDKDLTDRLVTAASLFDITVADHVIITPGECFSFRAGGLMDER